ncbi:hypothetical protein [Corynebacterium parakroppenstedtii]
MLKPTHQSIADNHDTREANPTQGVIALFPEFHTYREQPQGKPDMALSTHDYDTLEKQLFEVDNATLRSIYLFARQQRVAPLTALVLLIQNVCTALPVGTTFDIGLGPSPLNLFVAVLGRPGTGKGRASKVTTNQPSITVAERPALVKQTACGSGEGLLTQLGANNDDPPNPTLFVENEVTKFTNVMNRDGSTLRPNILSMFSGESMAVTNKTEELRVDAGTYSASLRISCQYDTAGPLVSGVDDGLSERFLWVETIDPFSPIGGTCGEQSHALKPVVFTQSDCPLHFTFPADIRHSVRHDHDMSRKTGCFVGTGGAHDTEIRARLASGLAALRSTTRVSHDDWQRAGLILKYSNRVKRFIRAHVEAMADEAEQDRFTKQVERRKEGIVTALGKKDVKCPRFCSV